MCVTSEEFLSDILSNLCQEVLFYSVRLTVALYTLKDRSLLHANSLSLLSL